MNRKLLATVAFAAGLAMPLASHAVDTGAVIGGAIGGGAGAGVGSKVGGTTGAVIGGAIGGAAGAAIGSSGSKQEPERVVVKERVVEKDVRVIQVHDDERGGPPGFSRGKKNGWKKHRHRDD